MGGVPLGIGRASFWPGGHGRIGFHGVRVCSGRVGAPVQVRSCLMRRTRRLRANVGPSFRERRARERVLGRLRLLALVVQKLPLLQPWITRYHVAMLRAQVLPILFLALAFSQSWVVGLTLLVAGPLIPLFMALVGMAAEEASKRQMNEIASMNDMVMDRLSAMLDIRLLGAVDRSAVDFGMRAEHFA